MRYSVRKVRRASGWRYIIYIPIKMGLRYISRVEIEKEMSNTVVSRSASYILFLWEIGHIFQLASCARV